MDDSQTTQPLPSHLHDLYLRYKIRTNKVISWLVSTARIRPKVVKDACENSRITVADLVDGARRLQDQDVTAPEELFWAIKDSISLRKELAQYYEMRMIGQESIRTHQHFTDCLEQISCALFPSPPFLSNRPQTNVLDQTEKPELRNLFSLLNLDETSDDYDRSESQSAAASSDIQCSQQQEQSTREQEEKWDESGQHAGSKRNEHEILELDGLGKFYEVLVWQIQLEKLINQVLSFWHLAKKGDITVTEAGWLTNVVDNAITVSAFAMDINLDEYFDTWAILGELDGISNSPVVTDLKPILTAMDDFKSTHYPRRATTKLSLLKKKWAFQVPSKLIPQDSSKEAYSDATSSATDLMLAGLLHVKEEPVFYNAYCVHTFHVSFEPGFRALYRYLVNPCGNLACLQRDKSVLAANLLLQLKVYQLWLKPECQNGPSSPPAENCRVKFLRFVLEFHDSLRAAVRHKMMHEAAKTSGECFDGTINKCLETLEKLKKLQEAKQWDLYQQAPMTAGMHMSWLREFANEKAHGLINEKGLVGALLHCYNALVTFNKIEKIPLLEHLCNIFVNHVFLGSRSNLNVCSVFRRFLGGTTGEGIGKKAKDKKRENAHQRILHPERLPCSAHHNRIKLLLASNTDYIMLGAAGNFAELDIARMPDKSILSGSDWKRIRDAWRGRADHPMPLSVEDLTQLQAMLHKEFHEGAFLPAKVNWLKVCVTSFDVMYQLALRVIKDMEKEGRSIGGALTLVEAAVLFVDKLLEGLDVYWAKGDLGTGQFEMDSNNMVRTVQEALVAVPALEDVEGHLWKHL